jgi:hypothetical protein
VLYRRGTATAAEIRCELPVPPSYSAVRALLQTLQRKGYVKHEARCMLKEIVATFFGGSPEREVQALIGLQAD